MVCDPDPGATDRAVAALVKTFPELEAQATMIVWTVKEALDESPLGIRVKY